MTSACLFKKCPKPVTCHMALIPTETQIELLNTARTTLSKSAHCLGSQQQLSTEFYVLTRALYMKHGQLRQEKSFRGLKEVRMCVKKYFGLEVEKVVKEMNYDFQNTQLGKGVKVHLPSRQLWHYLLQEILMAAALLAHTATRCTTVFLHVHRHLTAGMLIPTNMLFLSLLSRIWACCNGMLQEMYTWYQLLKPVLHVLQPTEVNGMPGEDSLPDDPSAWLKTIGIFSGPAMLQSGDDTLTGLMAKYQACEVEEREEIESMGPLDDTLPVPMEEDIGDPVNLEEGVEGLDIFPGNRIPSSPLKPSRRVLTPSQKALKEKVQKVKKASSLQELQMILLKMTDEHNKREIKEISDRLTDLQIRLQIAVVKGQEEQTQPLLRQGRKKLLRFLKTVRSKRSSTESCCLMDSKPVKRMRILLGSKPEKKSEVLKGSSSGSQGQGEIVSECKRTQKNDSVSKKKTEKIDKKDGKVVPEESESLKMMQILSSESGKEKIKRLLSKGKAGDGNDWKQFRVVPSDHGDSFDLRTVTESVDSEDILRNAPGRLYAVRRIKNRRDLKHAETQRDREKSFKNCSVNKKPKEKVKSGKGGLASRKQDHRGTESKASEKSDSVGDTDTQSKMKQKTKTKKVVDTAKQLGILPLIQSHDSSRGKRKKIGSVGDTKNKTKEKKMSQACKLVDDLKRTGLSSPIPDYHDSESKTTKRSDSASGSDPKIKKKGKKKLMISKLVNALNQLELASQK